MRRAALGTAATAFALTAVLGGCTVEDDEPDTTIVEDEGGSGITDGGGTGGEGEVTEEDSGGEVEGEVEGEVDGG